MATKKLSNNEPNYWILVLANKNQVNSHYNAQVIFDAQLRRKAWGLRDGSKNFKNMKKGDIVLLYIGSPYCAFAGSAVLGEKPLPFTKAEQNKFLDKVYRRKPKAGVKFSRARRFNVQVPAPLAVPELKFVKSKKNWGMNFQGAAVKINEADYNMVVAIACMLNPAMKKSLKKSARPHKNGILSTVQKALH
jgi:EVE domain